MSIVKVEDINISPKMARRAIKSMIEHDFYDGSIPPEDDKAVEVATEGIGFLLDDFYKTPISHLNGKDGDDYRALFGSVFVYMDENNSLYVAEDYDDSDEPLDEIGETEDHDFPDPFSEEPWDGYDEMGAKDVVITLVNGDPTEDELTYTRRYEAAHQQRPEVIEFFGRLEENAVEEQDEHREEEKEEKEEAVRELATGGPVGDGPKPQLSNDQVWTKAEVEKAEGRQPLGSVRTAASDRFSAEVAHENLPEPPQPEGDEDPIMPKDLSSVSDDDLRQLYINFNTCLARANWLQGRAQVDEAYLERLAKRERAKAAVRHKTVKPVKLMEAEIELDEEVIKIEEAHADAEGAVKAYGRLASSYSGNVDRLNRVLISRGEERQK